MTEAEWLACEEPTPMLDYLHESRRDKLSDRKLRLFCCAVCWRLRHLLVDDRTYCAVEVAERFADGNASQAEVAAAYAEASAAAEEATATRDEAEYHAAVVAKYLTADSGGETDIWDAAGWVLSAAAYDCADDASLTTLRDIVGNPFRPVTLDPAWRTPTGVALARGMYESRDFGAMPILADALQDAGCDSDDVLGHCRGPGPHVRGCWVVDLVLGKE